MSDGEPPEAAIQRAIADACLDQGAAAPIADNLRGWLEAHGVAEEDIVAALEAPPRLAIYRSLIRNGLASVIAKMLPRTRALMNAPPRLDRFERDLAAFADARGPRTHYLRDVPHEFVAWADASWRADGQVPPYLPDLAAFELAHFAVAAAPSAIPGAAVQLAIDRPLGFLGSTRLLRFAWAVHELPAEVDATTPAPARRDVRLLAYRDAEHTVRWLELTVLAAAVLERLIAGEPLGAAVSGACAAHDATVTAALPDVARLLADLAERGVVLGGC
jgi:hypothetical protein